MPAQMPETSSRGASGARLGIIAGRGHLPFHVAKGARAVGENPFILTIEHETDQDWSGFDHARFHIGDFAALKRLISAQKLTRIVMAGSVRSRPQWFELRPTLTTLMKLPLIMRNLISGGDDKLLRSVIALIEAQGCQIIGAHEVVPNLLATIGPLGAHSPNKNDAADIQAACLAARQLGALDIGQGAVAVGGRVIALEGLEGTDMMLARVAELRAGGRLPDGKRGVLVKLCKPSQDMRADLPSIGPKTVENAIKAGLSGIVVEAGRSLIVQRQDLIEIANRGDIFVVGQEVNA